MDPDLMARPEETVEHHVGELLLTGSGNETEQTEQEN